VPGTSLTIIRSSRSSRGRYRRRGIRGVRARRRGAGPRQPLDDGIQQIADTLAVLCGDLEHRVDPQLMELQHGRPRTTIVGLVDRKERRLVSLPRHLGDLPITRHQPLTSIYHEDKQIGVAYRAAPAFEHQFVERILAGAEHSAGVGQLEVRSLPLDRLRDDVARGSGDGRHDRAA
jgi:hypothetical protein